MEWMEIAIGIFVLIFSVYYWSISTFDFWSSRGVVSPTPIPFFGNMFDPVIGRTSIGEWGITVYNTYRDESAVGVYLTRGPALMLMDPNLIKDVLIKNFSKFSDRGLGTYGNAEPLSQNLLNLEPNRWRPLRYQLTTIFTSGKLKKMFNLLLECGTDLDENLEILTMKNEPIECRELAANFSIDVIGSCVFGLKMNSLTDENSQFRKIGCEIFSPSWLQYFKFRIRDYTPSIYGMLGPLMTERKIVNFFMKLLKDTVDYRKNNHIVRHDFMDLITRLRDHPEKLGNMELTDTLLASQLFIFFVAGFETSATTMSNALYEIAQNQTMQNRLRDEINSELAKTNGELTYDGIKSMRYLHMVFQETLRKYPPASWLMRKCTEEYTFDDTKLVIPAGIKIVVPVLAIHRDPRIYPKPEVFDPERFTNEAIENRHAMHWLPFGDGPRNCIGARFAVYNVKIGLITIIRRYKVEVCDKTQIPYIFEPRSFLLAPKHGIHLKISKIV